MNLILGDCLEKLKDLEDNSIDSIVTDPPYGISFMNKKWDYNVPTVDVWKECLRVLKPGGHLLSFAGTRTQHRMCVNIEDAGFEIRDMIAWVYGSGFPKSHNISKAIDKSAGVKRKIIGPKINVDGSKSRKTAKLTNAGKNISGMKDGGNLETEPATDEAKYWNGWGTALKPAFEPITVARKPLSEKTIVKNVLKHGTGGINIDECRVEFSKNDDPRIGKDYHHNAKAGLENGSNKDNKSGEKQQLHNPQGRFPANFIHDGSEEVKEVFPITKSGAMKHKVEAYGGDSNTGFLRGTSGPHNQHGDSGSASRFFYCAKTTKKDRTNEGTVENKHPTVKPTDLMCYLVRLVTPKGGTVLDPFMGSGSTGKACNIEGFNFIGIEMEEDSYNIAKERI